MKMVSQVYACLSLAVVLILVQSGSALRCWSCSSDLDITCMDHFNATKILQMRNNYQSVSYNQNNPRIDMPHLLDCTNNLGHIYGQKQVCSKMVRTVPNGRQIVTRECKSVSNTQQAGKCPTEATSRGTTIDFCEYCEYDGCNSATGLTTNAVLSILIPAGLFVFLRK